MIRFYKVRKQERGLLYRDGVFEQVLGAGRYVFFDPLLKLRLVKASARDPYLAREDLDVIVRSGELDGQAEVVDLKDGERALVFIDGRFDAVLGPGLYALFTGERKVRVERVDARAGRVDLEGREWLLESAKAGRFIDVSTVEAGQAGVLFRDGRYVETLGPGRYAFWKGVGRLVVRVVDLRESVVDVAGQELMTKDLVTIRLNAVATYRVTDALRAVTGVEDVRQALYREAQLVLRAAVGARELEALLADRDALAGELEQALRPRGAPLGIEVLRAGVRDVILPGEIRELMNKVTSARKAAEAALITRREETAAVRSQANTAKLLEASPVLLRMRELEVLEKVARKANLTVMVGEKGLANQVVKLL